MVARERVSYYGLRVRPEVGRVCPHLPAFPGGRGLRREAPRAKFCAASCQTLCGYVRLCAAMCGFWENEEKRRPEGQKLFLRPDYDRESPHRAIGRLRSLGGWRGRVGEAIWHRKSGFSPPSAAFRRLPPPSAACRRLAGGGGVGNGAVTRFLPKPSQTSLYKGLRLIDQNYGFP